MTVLDFIVYKREGRKITMITCYDYWSARILKDSPVDTILIGDSAGMVMHGFASTLPVTLDIMAYHVAAVARGAPAKFLVADLPFLSFRKNETENMNAVQLLIQAGAHAVKLEGRDGNEKFIQHLVGSGVPVIAHLGLTPQFMHQMGGFKIQGKSQEAKIKIVEDALAIEACGASAIVLECIPANLAAEISSKLTIPTIGIGAGIRCDGQVLVLHDLLGFNSSFKPKFVRRYLDGEKLVADAVAQFHSDVLESRFPSEGESFS
jgi:3-methyl-2-oxobutanoate hydroxymethyltransferase